MNKKVLVIYDDDGVWVEHEEGVEVTVLTPCGDSYLPNLPDKEEYRVLARRAGIEACMIWEKEEDPYRVVFFEGTIEEFSKRLGSVKELPGWPYSGTGAHPCDE